MIIDTITNNLVSVICGETGCGKSTQVPQFLFEMGYGEKDTGIIAMTQPRKLAVLNIANRISFEMGALAQGNCLLSDEGLLHGQPGHCDQDHDGWDPVEGDPG